MGTYNEHVSQSLPGSGTISEKLLAYFASGPIGRTLAAVYSDVGWPISVGANSLANSEALPACMVQWEHGYNAVEVVLDGIVVIVNSSVAAGTKVTINPYISDVDQAGNAMYSVASQGFVRHTFHDATAQTQATPYFRAVALVTAAPGAIVTLQGRAYISAGAASTWSASVGSALGPAAVTTRMIAREVS
jgi:hypothetical protein